MKLYKGLKNLYHFLAAHLGALIYMNPSKDIFVVGITGTKGKTTTAELISAGLETAGYKTVVSTSVRQNRNSMPGRFYLHKFLRDAVKNKADFAIIEVTSEGIVQSRHRGIDFDAGVFTGLHPEHIESHGSLENYRDAKLDFFRYIKNNSKKKNKYFFINAEDWHSPHFTKAAKGKNNGKDARIYLFMRSHIPTKLKGLFNKINLGAAESFLMGVGIPPQTIEHAFKDFKGVPGRMEFILEEPFKVVVDYAHTPESLEGAYKALKSETEGRLICVLGSAGGGRDKWKRPLFGKIAADYCSEIYLTSEDPYNENPYKILKDIESGITKTKLRTSKAHNILDRKQAIKSAINHAENGDTVVITGKGSETRMHLRGGESIPWSDREAVVEILKEKHLI